MNLQPSSRNCFVCGVENTAGLHMHFYETESTPVQVVAEYTVPERYQGYPGIVHGGIIATMLDEVTSRTIFRGDPPRFVVTARLSIRYRRPVLVEKPLKLTGRVVDDNGRVIKVAGEIHDLEGTLLAEAEAVLMEVDPSIFGDLPEEAQSWQVYPQQNNAQQDGESINGSEEGGR